MMVTLSASHATAGSHNNSVSSLKSRKPSLRRDPLTLKEVLKQLPTAASNVNNDSSASHFATARNVAPTNPPPYIPTDSKHFAYALLTVAGVEHTEACDIVEVSRRTAERWKRELVEVANAFFGRRVTYDFAARYVVEPELRRICSEVSTGDPTLN